MSVPREESKKYFTLLPCSNFREIHIPSCKRKQKEQKKQPNKFPDLSARTIRKIPPAPPRSTFHHHHHPNIPKSRGTGPLKADTENASIDTDAGRGWLLDTVKHHRSPPSAGCRCTQNAETDACAPFQVQAATHALPRYTRRKKRVRARMSPLDSRVWGRAQCQ